MLYGHVSEQWREANLAGMLRGLPVILCAPGPSLADVNGQTLRGRGRLVAAINTAYPHVTPDLWIGLDPPACYDRSIWWEPFPKITSWNWRNEFSLGKRIKAAPQVFFAKLDDDAHANQMLDRIDGEAHFAWSSSTLIGAIHILLWLGARTIFLVGTDMGGKTDYFDNRVLLYDERAENRHGLIRQTRELAVLALEANMRGVNLFSATPDSALNKFLPYVPVAEVIHKLESAIPSDPHAPILHVRRAERCLWAHLPDIPRQIVVGCDSAQEDLLEWWWTNYTRHNNYPVLFCDFGMSKQARQWCEERGDVASVREKRDQLDYWFLKPLGMLHTRAERALWIDLDCEILGSLDSLFDLVVNKKIAIRKDKRHAPHRIPPEIATLPNAAIYNTGVMAYHWGHPAIQRWAENMFAWKQQDGNTDQEPLSVLLCRDYADAVAEFPAGLITHPTDAPGYREQDTGVTVIRHWVAPQGKEYIRATAIPKLAATRASVNAAYEGMPTDMMMMLPDERSFLAKTLLSCATGNKPMSILEVGVGRGDSAALMLSALREAGKRYGYVGVDALVWLRPALPDWAHEGGTAVLVPGASRATAPTVAALAPDGFDFVLIDGCHCRACALSDWQTYGPLVRHGGILMFHDCAKPDHGGVGHHTHGVRGVYMEARESAGWQDLGEFVPANPPQERYGIGFGVLRKVTSLPPDSACTAPPAPSQNNTQTTSPLADRVHP